MIKILFYLHFKHNNNLYAAYEHYSPNITQKVFLLQHETWQIKVHNDSGCVNQNESYCVHLPPL